MIREIRPLRCRKQRFLEAHWEGKVERWDLLRSSWWCMCRYLYGGAINIFAYKLYHVIRVSLAGVLTINQA